MIVFLKAIDKLLGGHYNRKSRRRGVEDIVAVYCKASVRGSGEKHAKSSAGRHCQRQQEYKRNIEGFMLFASVSRGFFSAGMVRALGAGASPLTSPRFARSQVQGSFGTLAGNRSPGPEAAEVGKRGDDLEVAALNFALAASAA